MGERRTYFPDNLETFFFGYMAEYARIYGGS